MQVIKKTAPLSKFIPVDEKNFYERYKEYTPDYECSVIGVTRKFLIFKWTTYDYHFPEVDWIDDLIYAEAIRVGKNRLQYEIMKEL